MVLRMICQALHTSASTYFSWFANSYLPGFFRISSNYASRVLKFILRRMNTQRYVFSVRPLNEYLNITPSVVPGKEQWLFECIHRHHEYELLLYSLYGSAVWRFVPLCGLLPLSTLRPFMHDTRTQCCGLRAQEEPSE